jgi:cobyrinic acid a,c-diamide synthase
VAGLSLVAGLRLRGWSVCVFKKGPDYIDAAWLGNVAGTVCRNLDTYMVPSDDVRRRFIAHADAGVSVVEGNRGLFDGLDAVGSHSSAALAKLLGLPVVLVLDATKSTRTIAALVKGCQTFDSEVNIAGVILNRVAGARHEAVIREAIEQYCRLPVVGVIPKLGDDATVIPGRHLGLVTPAEFDSHDALMTRLIEIAERHLDLDRLIGIAELASPLAAPSESATTPRGPRVRIAYFSDDVFTFYYPENLEALQANGAELLPLSALEEATLPDDIDGLYIGGGFPETQAARLTANRSMMASVKQAAEKALPIYAECGGLIYLCRSIRINDADYPMVGLFDLDLQMYKKPVGHGYVEAEVDTSNPFFERGDVIRGHEFHYTGPSTEPDPAGCMRT